VILEVTSDEEFAKLAALVRSDHVGREGMVSKIKACRLLFDLGVPSVIASGLMPNAIKGVIDGTTRCTRFKPDQTRHLTGVRKWLCTGAVPRGSIYVSEQGGTKLTAREQRGSLLASGVMAVKGEFIKGDVVCVCAEDGALLGYGICRVSSEELDKMKQQDGVIVVHADYFYGTAFGFFE
jgi:glutamate 5-kinase